VGREYRILRNNNNAGGAVFAAYNNLILRVVFARQDTLSTGNTFELSFQRNENEPPLNSSSNDFFNWLVSKKSTIDQANEGVKIVRYVDQFNELSGLCDIFNSRYHMLIEGEYSQNIFSNELNNGIVTIPVFCFNHGDYITSKRVFQIIIHDHPTWIIKIPMLKYIFKTTLKSFGLI